MEESIFLNCWSDKHVEAQKYYFGNMFLFYKNSKMLYHKAKNRFTFFTLAGCAVSHFNVEIIQN